MNPRATGWQWSLLGLFVVTAAGLGAFALFFIGRQEGWGASAIQLETAMPAVPGLRAGTRVRVLGIPVGQVRAIRPPAKPGEQVVVEFWIDTKHRELVRADATTRIVQDGLVGERVLEVDPGSPTAGPVAGGSRLASTATPTWDELAGKLNQIVDDVHDGKGTVGKLLTDEKLYEAINDVAIQADQVLESVDENYRSVKQNWVMQRWVKDRYQLLVRPDAQTYRQVYNESDLFASDRAILSDEGKRLLDQSVSWIKQFDDAEAEVLIASYTADESDARLAEVVTRKQAEAVLNYLREVREVHKLGWFTRRKMSAYGFGNLPPPDGSVTTPSRRVEILAFVK